MLASWKNSLNSEVLHCDGSFVSSSAAIAHESLCRAARVTFSYGSQVCSNGMFSSGALTCSNCGAPCEVFYICPLHEIWHTFYINCINSAFVTILWTVFSHAKFKVADFEGMLLVSLAASCAVCSFLKGVPHCITPILKSWAVSAAFCERMRKAQPAATS